MSERTKILIGAVGAVLMLVVLGGALFLLTRDEAPEAVDLEAAVARVEAAGSADPAAGEPSGAEAADTGADPAPTPAADDSDGGDGTSSGGTTSSGDDTAAAGTGDAATGTTGDTAAGTGSAGAADGGTGTQTAAADPAADAQAGLAGVWTVQAAEGAVDLLGEPSVSFAGFRVNEVLSSVGDFTAVGRTAEVSGSIELTATELVAATVEVRMDTLRTDNRFRDGRMHRALDTGAFPLAVFTLVEPVELPAGMADGEAFSGSVQGDLTIKSATNRAVFDLQAQLVGDIIVAVGSSGVVFSDFGVTAPTAPIVVSVEDHGVMEFQLLFTR